jgi:hypothetical protein
MKAKLDPQSNLDRNEQPVQLLYHPGIPAGSKPVKRSSFSYADKNGRTHPDF